MRKLALLASLFLLTVTRAHAAENVSLSLKSNGTDIKGESSVTSLGRADTIECFSYEQNIATSGGKHLYAPLTITKRVDKSSPLLYKAMLDNENISATFRFFRPTPSGDGTTQQFYSVTLSGAHIVSVEQSVPDTHDKNTAALPPLETVAFSFTKITWTYTDGSITMQDDAVQMTDSATPTTGAHPIIRFPTLKP